MPTLPSGLTIGIGHQAIPKFVGPDWFKCPEGHFWYKRPDISITPPPYDGMTEILEDWVHSPVPEDIDEVKQYLYVLYRQPDGKFQWRGEWLNEFPQPGQLSKEDEVAWNTWISSELALPFLRNAIKVCHQQTESNRECSGVAMFYGEKQ
jgi:hypothetical protein